MRLLNTLGVVGLIACSGDKPEPEANSAPIVTSIEITPAEGVTTSTELLCVATATDDDNDALDLSYQWTDVDGTVLSETDSLALSPENTTPTAEITCTATVSDGEASVTELSSVTVENTAPTVSNVSISPETVLVNSLLECSFDAEDLDGEELTVSYSWTQNGTEVGTEASLQLDAENFSDDDVILCTVTVEDGYEGTASESAEVVIGNTAPVIGSATITPENPYSYETLTCTANDVTDLEGDEVTISYEWSIDGEIQTETSNMLTGPFLVGALIACRTTPNDGKVDGDSVDTDASINNTAPTLDTVSISPMVNIEADTLMTCEATASDVDNEELTITYAWTKSDGTVLGTEGELQLDATMVSPGDSIACTATVTDPHGASDSLGQTTSVINTDPVVDSAAEITGDATTTSTLTCAATFSDLNDGTLTPTFSWTNQSGTELSTTDSYTIVASETETGDELTCTASVEDADGSTLSSSAMVTIANTLPTLTGVTLNPDPVISTDSLTCSVDSTADIDEDAVTVLYEWSVDGVVQSETSDSFGGPLVVGSLISCTATPNDGKENGTSDTADVTVSNTAPVVDAVSLDAGPIYTDGTVTATVTLSDIDAEQTVIANYAWHVIDASNGGTDTEVQTGTDNTLDGSFFNKDDQVYVVVTPNDGVEDGSSVISSPLTIANSEPTGITASVTSSDMFYNDSTLTCAATASDIDPEDAVLTYTYAWSTGDTGADLVLSGSMMPGAEVTCTATATDGSGAAISVDAMETLMNRAPTVDSVTLPQDVTAETASILCDATGSDLDGETPTLTYAWTVGGVAHSETSDTLTDTFVYGDTIECTVTSADAMETGSSMTATTTVLNTVPVVSNVVLGPDPAYTDSSFAVTSLVTDVDAAQSGTLTASYQWYADGQMVGTDSAALVNGTMNEFFAKGQDVYVVVTPNDGVADGTPVQSNTVSVLNTAPTAPTVSISAANDPAEVGVDDLTCSIDVEATDIDGDSLTYDYTWYDQDGNWADETLATSDLINVYPGTGTDVGTWTCEVVANDGETDSAVADAVYEVEDVGCMNSIRLDSVQSSIQVPQTGLGFGTGSWTFEYWIQVHDDFTNNNGGTIMMMNESYSAYAFRSFYYGNSSNTNYGKARCYTYNNTSGSHNLDNGYTATINDGDWHHIACSYSGGTLKVFTDGVLTTTDSGNPSLNASSGFTIGEPRSGIYASYEAAPVNLGPIRISSTNRYTTDFTPDVDWSIDGNTVAQYLTTTDFDGQTLIDEAGGDNTGTVRDDVILADTCPEEDLDGDGVAAWEDCDDSDSSIYPFAGDTYGDGIDSDCDGLDCEAASDGSTYFAACVGSSTWSQAEAGCTTAGYDHLAKVLSSSEDEFIDDLRPDPTSRYWIGLNDLSGSWKWSDGTALSYSDWASNEPNNSSENCVIIIENNYYYDPNTWHDDQCSKNRGFICEKR